MAGKNKQVKHGTISKTKHGYIGKVQVNGKRIARRGKDPEKIQDLLNQYVEDIHKGLDISIANNIRELSDKFLQAKSLKASPRVVEGYKSDLDKRILPTFENKLIRNVTTAMANDWIVEMNENEEISTNQIRTSRKTAIALFNHAIKLNILERNPFAYSESITHTKQEMSPLSPAEVTIFLNEAKNSKHHALFTTLITTGMRVGEALALTWNDINTVTKEVSINKQYTNGVFKDHPKTSASKRTIKIGDDLVEVLKAHQIEQLEYKSTALDGFKDNNLVFSNEVGNYENLSNIRDRHFNQILEKTLLNTQTRIHDLRHTFASINLMEGVPVLVVSNHLGHSSAKITLEYYSHFIPNTAESPSVTIEKIIKKAHIK